MIKRMRNTELFDSDKHQRALILNKVSNFITAEHLTQFFQQKFKVDIEEIQLSSDKPIIIFSKEILETGFLKACFKLGTRNR